MGERSITPPDEILEEKKNEAAYNRPADSQNESHLRTIYGNEIKKYKLLTRDEERELAQQIKKGNEEARELLINSNLRLVIKLARQLAINENILSDLIQEGNIGLIRATKDFDPTKGVKFSSYAANWIFSYMRKYIRENQSLVKIGTTQAQRKIFSNLRKIERELEQAGISTNDEIIAERMKSPGITAEEVKNMRQRLKPILSIDTPLSSDEGSHTLGDYLETPTISPEKAAQKNEIINYIHEAINSLTDERERIIIKDRLLGDKTLDYVGKKIGVTKERVRQIEVKVKKN